MCSILGYLILKDINLVNDIQYCKAFINDKVYLTKEGIYKINNLSTRNFQCPNCQNKNDRDINASLNILDEGIRLAIKNGLLAI